MGMRLSQEQSVNQKQNQRQNQYQKQQLIQSMKVLQLSNSELEEHIAEELTENPVLELNQLLDKPDDGEEQETEFDSDSSEISENYDQNEDNEENPDIQKEPEDDEELRLGDDVGNAEEFQIADDFSLLYDDTIDEQPVRSQDWLEAESLRHQDLLNNQTITTQSLQGYLLDQLPDLDDDIRDLCKKIIENLDPSGYFTLSWDEFFQTKATREQKTLAQKALSIVQSMEPAGIGARSLIECFQLQLPFDAPQQHVLKVLLENHWDDLRHNRLPQIAKKTGFTMQQIQDTLAVIQKLNPRPGSAFFKETPQRIRPDLFVVKNEQGNWIVRFDDNDKMNLSISPFYREMYENSDTSPETRVYLRNNFNAARSLIDAIRQRKITLLKVGQAIINYQKDFLEFGEKAIRPLKMQQIADEVGIHITTVSRACSGKWIQTPQGVYPLEHFFSTSIALADDTEDEMSQRVVCLQLKALIDQEDKQYPYSDDELVQLLKNKGIKISRRTITKYRLKMDIPSSRERKIWGNRA